MREPGGAVKQKNARTVRADEMAEGREVNPPIAYSVMICENVQPAGMKGITCSL